MRHLLLQNAILPLLVLLLLSAHHTHAFFFFLSGQAVTRSASSPIPSRRWASSEPQAAYVDPAPPLTIVVPPPPAPLQSPTPPLLTPSLPLPPVPILDELDASPSGAATTVEVPQEGEDVLPTLANETVVNIRRMSLKDVASVFHIGENVFSADNYPQLYRTWSPYEVTDAMSVDPELCLVAEAVRKLPPKRGRRPKDYKEYERRTVGFILGSVTEKKKKQEGCAYLAWVAVNEEFQRQGIGTRLVRTVEQLFEKEGMRTIVADTPEGNVPARRFLENLGFKNPISHVYMSLNIANAPEHKTPRKRKGAPKQKPVKVRQMDIDDLAKVYALGEEVFTQELYPNLYSIWSEAEVVELFGSDSETCFVCEASDKTHLGFVLGTEIEKKGSSWRYGYLLWLAVSPKAQGLGVGRRLLNTFRDTMEEKGCRLLLCDTQASNVAARAFFEKNNFKDFEDHLYYTKCLDDELLPGQEEGGTGSPNKASKGMPQARLTRLTKTKKVGEKKK